MVTPPAVDDSTLILLLLVAVAAVGMFLAWRASRTAAAVVTEQTKAARLSVGGLTIDTDDIEARIAAALARLQLPDSPALRSGIMFVATAVLVVAIAYFARQQLAVLVYKATLMTMAAYVAYWIDRSLFPISRPHLLPDLNLRALAEFRRAMIVVAALITCGIGA